MDIKKIQILNTVIHKSLLMAARAHAWHFLTRGPGSYAQHKTFETLYETAHDIADRLAEPAMGHGINLVEITAIATGTKVLTSPINAAAEIKDLIKSLEVLNQAASGMDGMAWLANIAQESQGRLKQILFLLELQ